MASKHLKENYDGYCYEFMVRINSINDIFYVK